MTSNAPPTTTTSCNTEEEKKNKSLQDLAKSKKAVSDIKEKLQPVLQRLKDDQFGEDFTGQAQASLALSIGMMRYMGARIQGLDQGRQMDDPLRKELNNMKRVLAEIKKRKKPAGSLAGSLPVEDKKNASISSRTASPQSTKNKDDGRLQSTNDRNSAKIKKKKTENNPNASPQPITKKQRRK
jgi:hypothetical protein